MAKKRSDKRPDPDSMTFEQATEELEAIVERIEQGEIGLEESLEERRRGEALIRRSRAILDKAEAEIERIRVDDEPAVAGEPEDGRAAADAAGGREHHS